MSESPNVVACPECSSPTQAIEPSLSAAHAEDHVNSEAGQHPEVCLHNFRPGWERLDIDFPLSQETTPNSQADGDAEKIAAGIEAQRETGAQRPDTEVYSTQEPPKQTYH